MTRYCSWCEGKIPKELQLCSGCLMLSSEFIGTDIRPFISEKRNKETNELLGPGRGLKNEQRIKHLTQEIDLSISVPYFLKSQRKGSRPHQMYDSEEWGELVDYWTPYIEGDKFTILQDGESLCQKLNVNFHEVYKRTNTSYKPYPSGNSDYKSASSVERVEAFINLGRPDPVQYEDDEGLASWEKVTAHVSKILAEHE